MPEIPEGAKVPKDHKMSAADELEATLSEDELLAGMPALIPPAKLRIRQRNTIMKLALSMRDLMPDSEDESVSVDLDLDNLSPELLGKLLDAMADIDDFAESIALDKAAYAEWAQGKDYEVFSALLSRYSSAVGESKSSAS